MKKTAFFLLVVFLFSLEASQTRSKYMIAVKKNTQNAFDTLNEFKGLWPPRNHFYADPMLFKYKGLNYIFFEDYDYKKGVISYVTVDDNLEFSEAQCVLNLPYHLSFPFVFEDNGEIYMTPETFQIKEVVLFRAVEFPNQWEKVRTLVYGDDYVDSIVFKHDGYYWLLTSQADNSQMFIYYADSLESEFKPHPINHSYTSGRNAGNVFYSYGRLIRPVMDNRRVYGEAMILKEIVKLTPYEFIERELFRIDPTWAPGLTGTHTLSLNEDLFIYDGRRDIRPSDDAIYSAP